jgi:hypothetical protein
VVRVELDVGGKLVLIVVETLVVDEAVVDVRLEELELEELGLEDVRAKYAPMPATATITITIAATAVRAIPTLWGKKKKAQVAVFKVSRDCREDSSLWAFCSFRFNQALILGKFPTFAMQTRGIGMGLTISALLFIPIGLLDLFVAFDYHIGNWAASFLILPYLVYFCLAAILAKKGHARLGNGLAVGGAVFSTLIVIGVFFLALMFSAATEFG